MLSGVDRLRGESAQVDGGLNRVREGLSRLRDDARGSGGRACGDVTEIRSAIVEAHDQVSAFSNAATELRTALRAACPQPAANFDAAQAVAAADAARRHAVEADVGLRGLAGEFSGLQHGLAKP